MTAPQKLSPSHQAELASAYRVGQPVATIAREFGVSVGTVRNVVVRLGGELRPVGRPSKASA